MRELQGVEVLVIDDDPELLDMLAKILNTAGARVYAALDGQDGLRQFFARHPDVVLLDLMMPMVDGWQVCRSIRRLSDVPILVVTALSHEREIVRSLDCGADDCITKPFSIDVLLARTRALLRRAALSPKAERPVSYDDGHLSVDSRRRSVLVGGEPVNLSRTEYRLLIYLVRNADHVVSYQEILHNVWGAGQENRVEYVHVYIWHLRQKLEEDPHSPQYLLSEHAVGYYFETQAPRLPPVSVGDDDSPGGSVE